MQPGERERERERERLYLTGVDGPTITSSLSPLLPGEERVLALQESGIPSALSYARLASPPFPVLNSFTTCYWLRLTRFREESTLMSYAVSDDRDNELRMGEAHTVRIIMVFRFSKC